MKGDGNLMFDFCRFLLLFYDVNLHESLTNVLEKTNM